MSNILKAARCKLFMCFVESVFLYIFYGFYCCRCCFFRSYCSSFCCFCSCCCSCCLSSCCCSLLLLFSSFLCFFCHILCFIDCFLCLFNILPISLPETLAILLRRSRLRRFFCVGPRALLPMLSRTLLPSFVDNSCFNFSRLLWFSFTYMSLVSVPLTLSSYPSPIPSPWSFPRTSP